jgi:transcriptional regulator with XRE-family HTH domain
MQTIATRNSPKPRREPAESVLAKNLTSVRVVAGVTQQDLSEAAGISRATLAQIETGSSDPRLSTLVDLANALGMPVILLLMGIVEAQALASLPVEAIGKPRRVSPEDVERITDYVATGLIKDRLRAAQLGAAAMESQSTTPLGPLAAAILSPHLPGAGAAIGSLFGDLLHRRRAAARIPKC